jgi:hypothetical protein
MNKFEISPKNTKPDPNNRNWTVPRTYGVWELSQGLAGKRYRFGNYPVRGVELKRDYKKAELVALFTLRNRAKEYADELNA